MLEIIFNTKAYRNRVTKRPSIESNEGPQKKYVQIKSHVITRPDSTYPITFKPYKFDISQYGSKPRTKLTFEVTNVSEEPIELKVIDVPPYDMFEVDLPGEIAPGGTGRGEITLGENYVDKEFEKSVTIECSDQAKSRFTVPVKRVIRIPGETSQYQPANNKTVTVPAKGN